MSMDSRSDLTQSQANTVNNHATAITTLPEPPQHFQATDLDADNPARDQLRYYHLNGLLHQINRSPDGCTWMVDRRVHHHAQHIADQRDTLPCGHTGIHNQGNDEYACLSCGVVHDRDTVEEALE